jgi:putative endonuclease
MRNNHLKIGELGEKKAAEMLKEKGYQIVDRNKENKYGEIDIIAKDKDELVFLEVRSKTGVDFGLPEETVGYRKKKKLIRNAKAYLKYKKTDISYRIDVIGIIFTKDKEVKRVKHYKNITL